MLQSLNRCRRELKRFPTTADILERIDDGRPGADEAWAMIRADEAESFVWTTEMQHAYGLVRFQIADDRIAARMAFKQAYDRAVREAKERKAPVEWSACLGHDSQSRITALKEAEARELLTHNQVAGLLPHNTPHALPTLQIEDQSGSTVSINHAVGGILKAIQSGGHSD